MSRTGVSLVVTLVLLALAGLPAAAPAAAQSNPCNNVLRGAVVAEYSSFYNDDFAPENLIDGKENRSWSSAEGDAQPYIVFDLGETFEVDRARFNGYYQANDPDYEGDSIRGFRLEALADGAWTTVYEGEAPLQDRMLDYPFPAPAVASQIKIVFLSNHGGSAFEAAELAVCGQRATAGSSDGEKSGKRAKGKENPENKPLLLVQGDLKRDTTDTWEIELKANQVISLELQATTRGTCFSLHDPIEGGVKDNCAYDESVENTYRAGMYGIQILEDGLYAIPVWNGIGPYTLEVTEGYFGHTDGSVAVGQSVQGRLQEYGFDRWLITLSAGQIISLELQATTRGTCFGLLDPIGRGVTNDCAYDKEGSGYRASMQGYQVLTTGLYMVAVSNGIGDYTLTVAGR